MEKNIMLRTGIANDTTLAHRSFTSAFIIILACIFALLSMACSKQDDSWISKIRPDHPRLFFNSETLPQILERAQNEEKNRYNDLVQRVETYSDSPTLEYTLSSFPYRKLPDGSYETNWQRSTVEPGIQAAHTAFVYLVTGDKKYLEKAKRMLSISVEAYHKSFENGVTVNWYSTSRVHWLAAYDWLYNDLTAAERKDLMESFIRHIEKLEPGPDRPEIFRLNDSDHTTGFYGDRNLVWFTGLAAYNDGIDDESALRLLQTGYKYNIDLFSYRAKCAGDDGGLASATCAYSMGAYPWAQFNFLYTWRSAIGEDISSNWPHIAYFPVWISWNWLPGPNPREFGSGDCYHYDNALPMGQVYTHMIQIMDFYGMSHPDCAALAGYIRNIVPEEQRDYSRTWAFYPFLLTNLDEAPQHRKPKDSNIRARHFETLGQIFMRSGTGPDDTYCLFTTGSDVPSHKQHDENNFVIYKKGYLALDSGTRGRETGYQLRHYYSQTAAHNCILIHMPDEPFPGYWGTKYDGKEGQISCGGTYKTTGGRCAAFETNPYYTYAAGDATECYRPEKCELALRQIVFIMPDHFIVCDRVISTKAEYKKDWLLHTQNEPVVCGNQFRADHEEGRLWSTTLYPLNAKLRKVGGPGKEFYAAGKNWELAPEVEEQWKDTALFGNWRVDVSPDIPRKEDVFLHLIQAGDRTLETPDNGELIEEDGTIGVKFTSGGKTAVVTFSTHGKPSGHITISSAGTIIVDTDLIDHVMPQSGLAAG